MAFAVGPGRCSGLATAVTRLTGHFGDARADSCMDARMKPQREALQASAFFKTKFRQKFKLPLFLKNLPLKLFSSSNANPNVDTEFKLNARNNLPTLKAMLTDKCPMNVMRVSLRSHKGFVF